MKSLIYLIIFGAAGYLGYNYYQEHMAGGSDASADSAAPAAETAATKAKSPVATPAPAKAVQVFKSKIPVFDGPPGEKHLAKPGTYFVLERTSIEHETGVAAVVPGEEVKLLSRKGNGVMRVTSGKFEYELKESQLTNDLDLARAAEQKYVQTHPPSPTRP